MLWWIDPLFITIAVIWLSWTIFGLIVNMDYCLNHAWPIIIWRIITSLLAFLLIAELVMILLPLFLEFWFSFKP